MPKGKPAVTPGEKSKLAPASAKLAVAAYCYHNCHNETENNSHTTKLAIRDCPSSDCFLWPHRGWKSISGRNVGKRAPPDTQP